MKKERLLIETSKLLLNEGQLDWLPSNPRTWTRQDLDKLKASIERDPDFLEDRPALIVPYKKDKFIVFGGNMRSAANQELNRPTMPAMKYIPETDEDRETIKRRALVDNGSFGAWDFDALANEWDDLPLTDWGIPAWDTSAPEEKELTAEEIQRKKAEFEERMKAGEISAEDEEYQEFLEKFELKKTTDDCYTPEVVYEAVADYVADHYGLHRAAFVRPFYPGGDYQKEKYVAGCVVVDNPPFSILAEILKFYQDKKIKFFLFAPTLTLFSPSTSCTALPCGVAITYENGASVNTSFFTNLEPKDLRLRSAPELYRVIKAANDENLKELHKELPKYSYDRHIITAPFIGHLSRLGIEFSVPVSESERISGLDSQKEKGRAIYGKGYIVSEQVYAEREKAEREKAEREKAEREKAEREKAEREKAERWELSAREMEIVKRLTEAGRK